MGDTLPHQEGHASEGVSRHERATLGNKARIGDRRGVRQRQQRANRRALLPIECWDGDHTAEPFAAHQTRPRMAVVGKQHVTDLVGEHRGQHADRITTGSARVGLDADGVLWDS